jgi:hypothetical protein
MSVAEKQSELVVCNHVAIVACCVDKIVVCKLFGRLNKNRLGAFGIISKVKL